VIAAVIIALSLLYSGPALKYKAVPIVASLAHFFGAGLLFLLGYGLFHPLDRRALPAGVYFSLLICAGHLVHETKDYYRDRRLGLTTNAVKFGRGNTFRAAFVLFSLAAVYLMALAFSGRIPFLWVYGGLSAYILHVGFFRRTLAQDPGLENLRRFRRDYRLVYTACGVYMWLVLIWQIKK
jgi:4-hydroxybenzoate polyprenyltransferase